MLTRSFQLWGEKGQVRSPKEAQAFAGWMLLAVYNGCTGLGSPGISRIVVYRLRKEGYSYQSIQRRLMATSFGEPLPSAC